jgi:hypothetical protein
METAQINEDPNSLEAIRRETAENRKKTESELDEIRKESAKRREEFEREMEKVERAMKIGNKELNRIIGKLGNRMGDWIVFSVKPNLVKKFRRLGFVFEKVSAEAVIRDKDGEFIAEVDLIVENGEYVMAVEVKSKLDSNDIIEHLDRMEKVRAFADRHNDHRVYLGAVAGMVVKDEPKKFALKTGFYVIEPSGDTFSITAPKGEYSPRKW